MESVSSYECEDLIKELEKDISEFGNIDLYAFFDKIEGHLFLTSYDFIEEEKPLKAEELKNSIVQIMKASEILKILKKQNEVL